MLLRSLNAVILSAINIAVLSVLKPIELQFVRVETIFSSEAFKCQDQCKLVDMTIEQDGLFFQNSKWNKQCALYRPPINYTHIDEKKIPNIRLRIFLPFVNDDGYQLILVWIFVVVYVICHRCAYVIRVHCITCNLSRTIVYVVHTHTMQPFILSQVSLEAIAFNLTAQQCFRLSAFYYMFGKVVGQKRMSLHIWIVSFENYIFIDSLGVCELL